MQQASSECVTLPYNQVDIVHGSMVEVKLCKALDDFNKLLVKLDSLNACASQPNVHSTELCDVCKESSGQAITKYSHMISLYLTSKSGVSSHYSLLAYMSGQ